MSKLLPGDYFAVQDKLCTWFDDLRAAAGCKPTADTAAVLRAVEKLSRQLEEVEEEKAAVAQFCGYKNWGSCVNAALSALPGPAVVELQPEYNEVPYEWFAGPGKPSYDNCEKQLKKSHKVIRKTLKAFEAQADGEEPGWLEEMKAELLSAFVESKDPKQFEDDCLAFIYGVEEEPDPSEVWLPAAELARPSFEASRRLPPVAAEELLLAAEEAGVEITQQEASWMAASSYEDGKWFSYLLAAFLTGETRPERDLAEKTYDDAYTAAELGKLYDKDAVSGVTEARGAWNDAATLSDLSLAYNAYKEAWNEEVSWNELAASVRGALGLPTEIKN
jgi:hypothetical protein